MRVGVYGLGRFGTLWAKIWTKKHEVFACDRFVQPRLNRVTNVTLEGLLNCDVIFLTVPISAFSEVSVELSTLLSKREHCWPTFIDCCSVKEYPLQVLQQHLPKAATIIGTHPMFGPDSWHEEVYAKRLVVCPCRQSDKQLDFWVHEFKGMGFKVVTMTAKEHDREAAFTQGLTHLIGRTLQQMDLPESVIATAGYQLLRSIVAHTGNDSWQLFYDLQQRNPYSSLMRKHLHYCLTKVSQRLDRGQEESHGDS